MTVQELKDYEAMAKLELPEDERQWILKTANMLEESFAELSKTDVKDTPPLVTVLNMTNVLREDVSFKMLKREEILLNAPEQYDGYFQAPKTLE